MDGWMEEKGAAKGDQGPRLAGRDPAAEIHRGMEGRMARRAIRRPQPAGRSFLEKLSASAAGSHVGSWSGRSWPAGRRRGGLAGPVRGLVRPVGGGSGASSSVTVDDVGSSANSKFQSSAVYWCRSSGVYGRSNSENI
jgi:hypothetical protein